MSSARRPRGLLLAALVALAALVGGCGEERGRPPGPDPRADVTSPTVPAPAPAAWRDEPAACPTRSFRLVADPSDGPPAPAGRSLVPSGAVAAVVCLYRPGEIPLRAPTAPPCRTTRSVGSSPG